MRSEEMIEYINDVANRISRGGKTEKEIQYAVLGAAIEAMRTYAQNPGSIEALKDAHADTAFQIGEKVK